MNNVSRLVEGKKAVVPRLVSGIYRRDGEYHLLTNVNGTPNDPLYALISLEDGIAWGTPNKDLDEVFGDYEEWEHVTWAIVLNKV